MQIVVVVYQTSKQLNFPTYMVVCAETGSTHISLQIVEVIQTSKQLNFPTYKVVDEETESMHISEFRCKSWQSNLPTAQLSYTHKVVREDKVNQQTCWNDDNISRGRLLLFSSLDGHLSPGKSKYRRTRGAVGHGH